MRLSSVIVGLLSIGVLPASALRRFSSYDQATLFGDDDDDNKIPGDSPLELCDGRDHEAELLHIESVNLAPNPPLAGEQLVIEAEGTVSETIEEGAYILLTIKYGLIKLISTKVDLCEQIKNVDLECPIEKGVLKVTKVVELPKEIPPGKYSVLADVYTIDNTPITCLTANVLFKIGKKSALNFEL